MIFRELTDITSASKLKQGQSMLNRQQVPYRTIVYQREVLGMPSGE